MPFREYNFDEAQQIAGEFVRATQGLPLGAHVRDTRLWTEWVLDWWAATTAPAVHANAKIACQIDDDVRRNFGWAGTPRRNTAGEFLFDLSHSRMPSPRHEWHNRGQWERAFPEVQRERTNRFPLVLESEFGAEGGPAKTVNTIMEDAMKLLLAQSAVKIMVFASANRRRRGEQRCVRDTIASLARGLVRSDVSQYAAWVWVDIPWDGTAIEATAFTRQGRGVAATTIRP